MTSAEAHELMLMIKQLREKNHLGDRGEGEGLEEKQKVLQKLILHKKESNHMKLDRVITNTTAIVEKMTKEAKLKILMLTKEMQQLQKAAISEEAQRAAGDKDLKQLKSVLEGVLKQVLAGESAAQEQQSMTFKAVFMLKQKATALETELAGQSMSSTQALQRLEAHLRELTMSA